MMLPSTAPFDCSLRLLPSTVPFDCSLRLLSLRLLSLRLLPSTYHRREEERGQREEDKGKRSLHRTEEREEKSDLTSTLEGSVDVARGLSSRQLLR